MRIIELHAENIKRLSAVSIKPDGSLVVISGKNGAGKTSVLDAIWWALAGTKSIQDQPIRKGQETAIIRLDLGKLKVTRKFTKSGTTITVANEDGATYSSPQEMLNGIVGALTFDPLAFMDAKPADQFNMLRGVVKIDADLDALDKANKDDYTKRTVLNRQAESLRAQAAGMVVEDGLPEDDINTADIIQKITDAGLVNAARDRWIRERKAKQDKVALNKTSVENIRSAAESAAVQLETAGAALIDRIENEIERLKAQIVEVRDKTATDLKLLKDGADARCGGLLNETAALASDLKKDAKEPPDADVDALTASLKAATSMNEKIAIRDRRDATNAEAEVIERQSAALTAAMKKRDKEKADSIAAANMPVPGLSLGDGVVLFNDLPLDQASDADQLRVSAAIAISGNQRLRVLRVRDGSRMDENGLRMLGELADANDMQIWVEKVAFNAAGEMGIVIEDGHVKGAVDAAADA